MDCGSQIAVVRENWHVEGRAQLPAASSERDYLHSTRFLSLVVTQAIET